MITVKNVTKRYSTGKGKVTALENISFTIEKPQLTTVVGPSGSGKSTLLHLLGGLDRFDEGRIRVNTFDIANLTEKQAAQYRNAYVGFVFQTFYVIKHFTLFENIALPLLVKGASKAQTKKKVRSLMKKVGLEGLDDRFPTQISGGQVQRLVIARALVIDPKIILADEPTGNLDTKTGDTIISLLKKLQETHDMNVVIITHDKHIAAQGDSTIHIIDGHIHEIS